MTPPQYQVPGRHILNEVLDAYQPFRPQIEDQHVRVVVFRFEPAADAPPRWVTRMAASEVSAAQKERTFTRLGVRAAPVALPDRASLAQLLDALQAANEAPDVAAIIVQTPLPARLERAIDQIEPSKDIDALGAHSQHPACATADGIARIAAPFLENGSSCAVVGARGFVGSGVVELLHRGGHRPLVLDQGDDLRQVRDVDVVISTTGRAGLLTAEHLHTGHRLVIDSGFVPHPAGPIGDVHPSAAHLPQTITPVPGGIGPVEMATLAERLVTQLAAPQMSQWRFLGRGSHTDAGVAAGPFTTVRRGVERQLAQAQSHDIESARRRERAHQDRDEVSGLEA
ncbi:MAG: bifunctional 5,10-methylenetetrahydrofolate dehydrogenase/5,10-methenyltetrahydrofolate cyclohydrolase [Pseudonocardiaceae bacterium]|nr:MAG: bifunctional 5,10-methylenetetrahydrofolate dehydrogenase/5,10-methenyltetrahydrofolate cyclohydrolase [Pseudonocardiaceae bacterium]